MKTKTILSEPSFRNFILMIAAILLLSSPLLFIPKEAPTFWINDFHSPFLDQMFYYFTFLGDGLILIPVFLFLLSRSYVWAGFFAVFVAIEAILVQLVLKKGFFEHLERPAAYISNFNELHQVTGVDIHTLHTFPSGHTQTIFLVIVFLAIAIQKKNHILNIGLLLIAIITGLSRVYILQHFFIDVWFGAFIGVSIPILTIYFLQKYGMFPLSDKRLMKK